MTQRETPKYLQLPQHPSPSKRYQIVSKGRMLGNKMSEKLTHCIFCGAAECSKEYQMPFCSNPIGSGHVLGHEVVNNIDTDWTENYGKSIGINDSNQPNNSPESK